MIVLRRCALVAALAFAARLLLPAAAAACVEPGVMACCAMEGKCDCGHSDAAFARCQGQDAAAGPSFGLLGTLVAVPSIDRPVAFPLNTPVLALASERLLLPPPTPPPRSGRA